MNSTTQRYRQGSLCLILLLCCILPGFGQSEASIELRFNLVHESLIKVTTMYFDNIMETFAFLLIVIGWLMTSANTREYLIKNKRFTRGLQVVSLIIAALDIGSHFAAFGLCQTKLKLLASLEYMAPSYYHSDAITWLYLLINAAGHLMLFILIQILLQKAIKEPAPEESK